MNDELRSWLMARQGALDALLTVATESYVEQRLRPLTPYDWQSSLEDLLALGANGDCSYDRPSIGAQYAMWYHPRRVEGAVRALEPVFEAIEGPVHVVDLGTGTGAGVWAAAILEAGRIATGAPRRPLVITAIDMSPFMLDMAEVLLDHLRSWLENHEGVRLELTVEWRLSSWTKAVVLPQGTVVALGSYLFDWSDVSRIPDLAKTAMRLFDAFNADWLILASAPSKGKILAGIAGYLVENGRWSDAANSQKLERDVVWTGRLEALGGYRRVIGAEASLPRALLRPPMWSDELPYVVLLQATKPGEQLPLMTTGAGLQLVLDEDQDLAADPTPRTPSGRASAAPTAILGAAGSGKSRVLVERVARELESASRDRRAEDLLMVTFNIDLTEQLEEWLVARLRAGSLPTPETAGERGDRRVNIPGRDLTVRILNWDKMPTRIWKCSASGADFTPQWIEHRCRDDHELRSLADRRPDLVKPSFLKAELHRVIYGRRVGTLDEYLDVARLGRSVPLQRSLRQTLYPNLVGDDVPRTFTHVRIDAHRRMTSGVEPHGGRYDAVFVDEYQDFTPADFDLVRALAKDTTRVVVAGDPAQALHLGKTSGLPGIMDGRRWRRYELRGSYRLPIRVCEAIEPLARSIKTQRGLLARGEEDADQSLLSDDEIQLPESVKTAVLGVRPILIAGGQGEVRDQAQEIVRLYKPALLEAEGPRAVTIAEGDDFIGAALGGSAVEPFEVRTESMRKIKGLERPCVVWSTKASIPAGDSLDEWIYTIVTRSTCLVVIALSQHTSEDVRTAVTKLRRDRLLFWTRAAEETFDGWHSATSTS